MGWPLGRGSAPASKRGHSASYEAFLNGKIGDGMAQRDRYMSLRIKEIWRNHKKALHVGGWEHLLDAPGGKTLYGLLKGLRPKRILSL